MKKALCLTLSVFVLVLSAVPAFAKEGDAFRVRSIAISSDTLTLRVDQIRTLFAYVMPTNASDRGITWESSDSEVALVEEDGVVIGISPGTATIAAVSEDKGYRAECAVTVQDGILASATGEYDVSRHPYASVGGGQRLYAAALRSDAKTLLANKDAGGVLAYQNKTIVSAAALRGANYESRLCSKALALRFDTVGDGAVQARITIDSADLREAAKDIDPSAATKGSRVEAIASEAGALLGRPVTVVSCGQSGSYGMMVEIAAPAGQGLGDSPTVYRYRNGALTEQTDSGLRLDKNGYLHFNTDTGGDYVIA